MTVLAVFISLFIILMIIGKINNQADWGHWGTNIVDGLVRIYCRRFHRVGLQKIEIPLGHKLILASNHISGIDPFLLITATTHPIRFMIAKEEYEKPILHWMFKAAGCIPVDRNGRVEGAFRRALRAIESGELIAIFAQGGIHYEDKPRLKIKSGIISLSKYSQCWILPVRINGIGAPGTVFDSVVTRSHINFDVDELVSPEAVQSEEFKQGISDWFVGKTEKVFPSVN